MTKITCDVENCTYNKGEVCYAGGIHISEQGIRSDVLICCNSYVDKETYHNSLELTEENAMAIDVLCLVGNCKHYKESRCTRQNLHIGGSRSAHTYIETKCINFEER